MYLPNHPNVTTFPATSCETTRDKSSNANLWPAKSKQRSWSGPCQNLMQNELPDITAEDIPTKTSWKKPVKMKIGE